MRMDFARQVSSSAVARAMSAGSNIEFIQALPIGRRTVAIACDGDAFAPPGEAEALGGRGLDGDATDVEASDLRDRLADDVAMRADLRRLADDRRVEMGDQPAAGGDARDSIFQEDVGRSAFPAHVRGRKVRADVAIGDGAENGVGEGVQQHVGVGMADSAASWAMRTPPSQM